MNPGLQIQVYVPGPLASQSLFTGQSSKPRAHMSTSVYQLLVLSAHTQTYTCHTYIIICDYP